VSEAFQSSLTKAGFGLISTVNSLADSMGAAGFLSRKIDETGKAKKPTL